MSARNGQTIGALLAENARARGDRTALIDLEGPGYTHAELFALVESGAAALREYSADRVAVLLPQGAPLALVLLAVASSTTCAPLNHEYRRADIREYLERMHISLLVTDPDAFPEAAGAARDAGVPVLRPQLSPGRLGFAAGENAVSVRRDRPAAAHTPGDIALLLHTSGSTARAKIVPLTDARLLASAHSLAASLELDASDRCLNMMPLFHVGALVDLLLGPLSVGGSVIVTGDVSPASFEAAMPFHPTWYQGVPTMLQSIVEPGRRLSPCGLRFIRSVSAPLPGQLLSDVEDAFGVPVIEIYGMTEAAGLICSNPLPPGARKRGSVGLPVDHDVLILDDSGNRAVPMTVGEVIVRGESVIDAYEGDDELNREQFFSGWLRTGDLGYLEDDGYLYITGRLKDLVNRGGEKISPAEIDRHLLEHPEVVQAGAFPVAHPTLGEEINAAVVLREASTVGERELQAFLAGRVADFKVPRRIYPVGSLPTNAAGKLVRGDLPLICGVAGADTQISPPYTAPDSPLSRQLAAMWQSALGVERVGMDDNFFELGGDSLSATTFVTELRDRLGADVFVPQLYDSPTIRDVAKALNEHTSNSAQQLAAAMSGLPEAVYDEVSRSVSGVPGLRKRPESLVFGRNTLGSRTPVFISTGMDRTQVSQLFGADQPVYWMRNLLQLECRSPENTRALASYYVREIQDIQPDGPLILVGNCEGAKIAAYAAVELRDAGRDIALLYMMEQLVPVEYAGRTRLVFARQSNFNPHRKFDAPEAGWRKYYTGELSATVLPWKHPWFLLPEYVDRLIPDIQREIEAALAGEPMRDAVPRFDGARSLQRLDLEDRNVQIEVRCPRVAWTRNQVNIEVRIVNRSEVEWLPYEQSGIFLAARWVNRLGHRGHIARWVRLQRGIKPGERRTMEFPVRTPRKPGRWKLDVDMAEEGICLFQDVTGRKFHREVLLLPSLKKTGTGRAA